MNNDPARWNVLILYTELAGYTMASVRALVNMGNVNVHIIRWPVNAEAPFNFQFDASLKVYDRKEYTTDALVQRAQTIQPDLILCSGWSDKGYLAVCRSWRNKIPVVLAMDNKWFGTIKQQIARVVARFTLHRCFNACWVPGTLQRAYARKLGFPLQKIKTGFYTCDISNFSRVYAATRENKSKAFPHVFIYAGRYYDFKGVNELWSAFARLKQEHPSDWKLVCLGTGDVPPFQHPDIVHEGFVQPELMESIMARTGVFILPSRFEPWAVVVQEFAAAGFPLLLSDAVGAGETFLQDGKNGFSFRANDAQSLQAALHRVTQLSDEALLAMGDHSSELAAINSPEKWAQTLMDFVQNN